MLSGPRLSAIPVLIAVPHAGREYTDGLLDRLRYPELAALRLEDRYADLLAQRVAERSGATLLVAEAPRAMIDLNRAPDDIDWEMFSRGAPSAPSARGEVSSPAGRRARNGLGLIPRRLPGLGELWKRRHQHEDLQARIDGIHTPYHVALGRELAQLRLRWGVALLIDLHSMPSLAAPGSGGVEFVIGDRFGARCDGGVIATAFRYFAERGRRVAHNRPYAGGYVLERHGAPSAGCNALQLEIDRASYLDARCAEPGEGLDGLATLLAGLVRELAETTAALGRVQPRSGLTGNGWTEAAE